MARLSGIEMNDNDKIIYALTRINGIGWPRAKNIMSELKLDESKRMKDLGPDELTTISSKLEEFQVEGDLVRKIRSDIQRLRDIGSYRGLRHSRSLPVRGQRTKTNARTKRGKRKTIGAFKKEVLAKTAQTVQKEGVKDAKK